MSTEYRIVIKRSILKDADGRCVSSNKACMGEETHKEMITLFLLTKNY